MTTARGSFEVLSGGEEPLEPLDADVKLTHASGTQRFSGDIEADGAIDWLMLYRADKTARFVGLQRITGSLSGRKGSFVVEAVGDHDGSSSRAAWTVVEGSGSDALAGISGSGTTIAPGGPSASYELEYEIAQVSARPAGLMRRNADTRMRPRKKRTG